MPSITPVGQSAVVRHFVSYSFGGGDGILRNAFNELLVEAEGTPSLYVTVATGSFIVSERLRINRAAATVGPFAVPSSSTRIDLVQYTLGEGFNIKQGVEGGSAPSVDADSIPLATVTCPVTMTVVKDADDSTNGYITDARGFL